MSDRRLCVRGDSRRPAAIAEAVECRRQVMEEQQPLLDFEGLDGKRRRARPERLQQIQRLHHCAFRKQWKADNKPNDNKTMEAAFRAQQKQMAERKIRVNICFTNGARTSLQQILNSDTDTMLAAIYLEGLAIETAL